jgi:hypothetical protein
LTLLFALLAEGADVNIGPASDDSDVVTANIQDMIGGGAFQAEGNLLADEYQSTIDSTMHFPNHTKGTAGTSTWLDVKNMSMAQFNATKLAHALAKEYNWPVKQVILGTPKRGESRAMW